MRFGLNFPLAGPLSDASVVAQLAREAEDAGWDGCFVWDHLLLAGAPPLADPWIALALIAQATSRIRLGPLVTPLFRRNPAKLAYETVTLHYLSKGRLVLGVGLGSDAFGEISTFGGPLDDKLRAEMLDEGLTVLSGLWSGQPFSFDGKHYRLNNAQLVPPCLQRPRIPIWIAGSWPRKPAMRRAARHDGVVPVRGDLTTSLTLSQVTEMVAYIDGFRSGDAPFEVIHFGSTTGSRSTQERQLVVSYAQVGVTWWIETMPFDPQQFDHACHRIQIGPPR
jgi:alkanesulfonate monooxygenase SsuD/methylene tetrahydromethanopterin reductase-like flavin-dependent oxidoreductase (luciferase family)